MSDSIGQCPQEIFNKTYISSSEIAKEIGVSRTALVNARKRGLLPNPIMVNESHLVLWERATVRPYIDAWKIILGVRRTIRHD